MKKKAELIQIVQQNIRRLVREQDYRTIEDFCHNNEISKSTMSTILIAANSPSLKTLEKIAKALKVQPYELLKPQSE